MPENPYVTAQREFIASKEYDDATNPETLRAPANMRRFLQNRIEATFMNGVKAGELIAANRIREIALGNQ